MGGIALTILAVVAIITLIIAARPSPAPPTPPSELPTDKLPEVETSWLEDLLKLPTTDRTYREEVGKAEIAAAALTEEKVSQPEVYATSCPPLLYKVSYFDENHNWVSKTVLATSARAAAASLGKIAGYGCFVSSMSGQQESMTYHATGELPAETVVASTEQLAAAAMQKAAETTQKEIDEATIKVYTSYPRADKIAASLICDPPQSLSSSAKDRIAAFRAKDPAYQQEVINAYKAYAVAKG